MTALARRNAAAMRAGQWAYDNAAPDYSEAWIDSAAGQAWLNESADSLLLGLDVTIRHFPTRISVDAGDFIAEFAQRATELYSDDDTYSLEWALVRGHAVSGNAYRELAREVAKEMLMKHAGEAEKAREWLEDCA